MESHDDIVKMIKNVDGVKEVDTYMAGMRNDETDVEVLVEDSDVYEELEELLEGKVEFLSEIVEGIAGSDKPLKVRFNLK